MNETEWPNDVCLSATGEGAIPDERVIEFLDNADERRYQLSQASLGEELALLREAMSLHYSALSFAADHMGEWSEQDQVEVGLMARVFNLIRAEAKLVLYGYWGEIPPMRRTVYESVSRALLVHWFPNEAKRFLQGKSREQGWVQEKIAPKLAGTEADNLRALRRVYHFESVRTHPSPESLAPGTYGTHGDIGYRAVIGGTASPELVSKTFGDILSQSMLALKTLGVLGLHKATDDWPERYDQLENAIMRLVNEHRESPE